MLALAILGLLACESASSFKFNKVPENQDGVIYYPNIPPNHNYDNELVKLNEQKKNFNRQIEYLDKRIENIDAQKENLDTEIEKFVRKKDALDREIDKLYRQKDDLDREIDIIYKKRDNFDRNIDYLNRQKDQVDNEIDKIDLEIGKHNIDSDRDIYEVRRAAVEDNEYRITINLPGYNEKEIVVKSGKGRLVVQALRDVLGEPKRSFQNIRNLPYFVTENGSWSYKWGVLRIVFPVIQRTRHEKTNTIYRNGVISKSASEKKYTVSSTEKAKVPMKDNDVEATTYVSNPDYDVKAITQVTSQGNDIGVTTDGKIEDGEIEAITQVTTQAVDIDANADSKSEVGKVETTTQETIQGDGEGVNTHDKSDESKVGVYLSNGKGDGETTVYDPKHDDEFEVITPTYIPNQKAYVEDTTYSVTANDDVLFVPVV